MSEQRDRAAKGPVDGNPFGPSDFTAFNGQMMSACAQAGQAFLQNAMAWNQEVARFANARMEANAELLQRLPSCTSWDKAAELQADYFRSVTEAYMAEMPKLTEQAQRTCSAMLAPVVESAGPLPKAASKP